MTQQPAQLNRAKVDAARIMVEAISAPPSPSLPVFWDRNGERLPSWVKEFRPMQWDAVRQIVDAFASGKKYVMLDAPTGVGKTLVAETVRRMMSSRAIYVCSTRTLQDQFANDFKYAKVLKGRANYPTYDQPDRFEHPFDPLSAEDCLKERTQIPACSKCEEVYGVNILGFDDEGVAVDEDDVPGGQSAQDAKSEDWHCPWCHPVSACLYETAKRDAMTASLSCMNLAYYLTECNGPGKFSGSVPLVIIDEADLTENQLMSFIEVNVSHRRRVELGLSVPDIKTMQAQRSSEVWAAWVKDAISAVNARLEVLRDRLGAIDLSHPETVRGVSLRAFREYKGYKLLLDRLEVVEKEIPKGGWVYTGYERKREDHPVIFRPAWVHQYAPEVLWKHAPHFLLMSATMLSGDLTARELGMEDGSYTMVSMGSAFPVENRRVYVAPKANMTQKMKEDERPKMAKAIDALMSRYPNERMLVHTVSYDLMHYLAGNVKDASRITTYTSAKDRNSALARFRNTPGAVMLAPSFERGVDLRDEDCRVIAIAKVPYPSLGDKQVVARLYSSGGQEWYHLQTIRSIVQMSGRGVRHEEDWADIYILDMHFLDLWDKRRRYFPAWWREAVVWHDKLVAVSK